MNEFTGERVIPGQVNIDLWNEHQARYAFASRFVEGRRILDIGCGSGYGSAELSRKASLVAALDVAPDVVHYAQQDYQATNIVFLAASASALPFPAATFDVITAFEVIEHVEDWRDLIADAARALAPGGIFLVSTPNREYYTESRGPEGSNPYHVHEFDADEFTAELRRVFPEVRVLLQNRLEAHAFYPAATFFATEARIDSSAGGPREAHFFLAVCSREPVEDLRSFVYVPRAANVLREREQHIALLEHELQLNQEWLAKAHSERDQLLAHLEQQNRWALELEQNWRAAQQRIVELQDQFASEQRAALHITGLYEQKITELEAESRQRADWALDTEARLTAEIQEFKTRLSATVEQLHSTETVLDQRTRWADDLQAKLDRAAAQLEGAKASRWLRAGRVFGVGPRL